MSADLISAIAVSIFLGSCSVFLIVGTVSIYRMERRDRKPARIPQMQDPFRYCDPPQTADMVWNYTENAWVPKVTALSDLQRVK